MRCARRRGNLLSAGLSFRAHLGYVLSDEFDAYVEEKQHLLDASGLKVSQIHLTYYPAHVPPLDNGGYDAYEEYMLPMLIKELYSVSKLGCKIAIIHLFFNESLEERFIENANSE